MALRISNANFNVYTATLVNAAEYCGNVGMNE